MVDRLIGSPMHQPVESCADLIESRREPAVDLSDVSERVRDFERRADLSCAAERVVVPGVPVLALRPSAFRNVESDRSHRAPHLIRESCISPPHEFRKPSHVRTTSDCD